MIGSDHAMRLVHTSSCCCSYLYLNQCVELVNRLLQVDEDVLPQKQLTSLQADHVITY